MVVRVGSPFWLFILVVRFDRSFLSIVLVVRFARCFLFVSVSFLCWFCSFVLPIRFVCSFCLFVIPYCKPFRRNQVNLPLEIRLRTRKALKTTHSPWHGFPRRFSPKRRGQGTPKKNGGSENISSIGFERRIGRRFAPLTVSSFSRKSAHIFVRGVVLSYKPCLRCYTYGTRQEVLSQWAVHDAVGLHCEAPHLRTFILLLVPLALLVYLTRKHNCILLLVPLHY